MALNKTTWVKRHGVIGYLWVDKPPVIFTARVNNPDGQVYPTREINFDNVTVGAYTDIEEGQTVIIGTTEGADDLGRQRIKGAFVSNLQIGWTSIGEHDGELILPDNAWVSVLDERRVWSKTPFIELASGTSYKDFDIGWVDGEFAQPPVANLGVWYANFVDPDTGVITVDFDSTNSFSMYPMTLLGSVLWDVADGTITVGVDTDQLITATFPPGRRYVSLTVTDANGQAHTAYALVVAAEPTGINAPIYDFDASFQNTAEGTKATFTVRQAIDVSDYPDGTTVLYWENEYYDGVLGSLAGQTGREHVRFCGWIDTEPANIAATDTYLETSVTLECLDVAGKLAKLPGFPQVVSRKASPANWYEMYTANADRFIHYLLHWHSTALTLADFYISGSGDVYAFGSFTSDGANLYSQVDGRAQATGTGYRLTSDSQGIIRIVPDPQFQETGDRTATVIVALDEDDISSISYTKTRPPRYHWLRASALTVTTNEITAQNVVFSIAPGAAPGQGESAQEVGNRLVINQAQLNVFTGNKYARDNAPESTFDVELTRGGFAGIEPALMQWVTITTTAQTAAQRGLIFTAARFLPLAISRRYDSKAGSVSQSFTGELEVVGQIAATYVPPTANLPGYTPPSEYFGEVLDTADTGFSGGSGNIAFVASDGYLYRTAEFSASVPTWERFDLAVTGDPCSFTVDAYSPLYLGTGSTVNAWVATADASNVLVYYITDLFAATPTVTLKFTSATAPNNGDAVLRGVLISSERITQNFVIVVWHNDTSGTYAAWTTDNSTFTEVVISAHVSSDVTYPSLAVIGGGLAWAGAYTVTASQNAALGKVFKTLDSGATWSQSHGTLLGSLGLCIHVPFADNDNRDKMWYSKWDWSGGDNRQRLIYYDGTTENDRSYDTGGTTLGSRPLTHSIATNPNNSNEVIVAAWGHDGGDRTAILHSLDQGLTWTEITDVELGTNFLECDVDGSGNIYAWGADVLAYFPAGTTTEIDKTGNIFDDFSFSALVIGIAGG